MSNDVGCVALDCGVAWMWVDARLVQRQQEVMEFYSKRKRVVWASSVRGVVEVGTGGAKKMKMILVLTTHDVFRGLDRFDVMTTVTQS